MGQSTSSRREFLTAAPVGLLALSGAPLPAAVSIGPAVVLLDLTADPLSADLDSKRLFRIVKVSRDGTEEVMYQAKPELDALAFCRSYNSATHITGLRAEAREIDPASIRLLGRLEANAVRPALPPMPVGIYAADGTLSRTVELEDPREAFCKHYNDLAAAGRHAVPIAS